MKLLRVTEPIVPPFSSNLTGDLINNLTTERTGRGLEPQVTQRAARGNGQHLRLSKSRTNLLRKIATLKCLNYQEKFYGAEFGGEIKVAKEIRGVSDRLPSRLKISDSKGRCTARRA